MPPKPAKIKVISGTVEFKAKPGDPFTKLPDNKEITFSLGNLLKKHRGANVEVKCGEGSFRGLTDDVPMGLGQICSITRNSLDPKIPYIISPRDTLILNNKPTLRWNHATSAEEFEVSLKSNGETIWKTKVDQGNCQAGICQLAYPDELPLQPEVNYELVVETDTEHSSAKDTPPGFKLIAQDKAEEIRTKDQQIQQNESSGIKTLELADLYTEFELIAEAIELLESLTEDEKSSAVYRQLGQLYQSIGLPWEAEVQYDTAVSVAQRDGDQLELALAQTGLGEVRLILGKKDEAKVSLEAAKAIYQELGDADWVSYLETRLNEISP